MTQVQTMTNPELNRALAELMGYTVELYETFSRLYYNGRDSGWLPGEETAWKQIPDYAGDPAASLEVQTAAIAKDTQKYINNLALIRLEMCIRLFTAVDVAVLILASPRERAEAAYITLSQGHDDGA